jgi:hypothetical protein
MKKKTVKAIESLQATDLEEIAVWEFARAGRTEVKPVKPVPVRSLKNRVVGTQVRLANGTTVWGIIGNIEPCDDLKTIHFLTLSVLREGVWFTLARYHDLDYSDRGPEALARFLGLSVDEVFPISYDISHVVLGDSRSLAGTILRQAREKLTRAQIIQLAVG